MPPRKLGDGEDGLALLRVARVARTERVVVVGTAVLVDPLGPGDLGDERMRADELPVGAIEHVEEAVAIGGAAELFHLAVDLGVEGHELVHAVEVPAVVRGGLEAPDDLAGVGG